MSDVPIGIKCRECGETRDSVALYQAKAERAWAVLGTYTSWMRANVSEMECRGDDDCDHCLGLALLAEGEALTAGEAT